MINETITRSRSEFKVSVFENENGGITIVTYSKKWASFISCKQNAFVSLSPKKWNVTSKGNYSLWIPKENLDSNVLNQFVEWLHEVNSHLWLSLNKNLKDDFIDELDYCVAADWNISFDTKERTEVGEAEYQIKYQYPKGKIDDETAKIYAVTLTSAVMKCSKYLPIIDKENLLITTIPSIEEEQNKLSWAMARFIQSQIGGLFLTGTLTKEKPKTKTLSVSDKISLWKGIYANNDNINLSQTVEDKDVIIVDDLYQSGASIWTFAEFLKQQGCRNVMGLVAVKSQRDSDNKN
ncbi:phosphoribosyltransferase [Paenibacillus farraposensis]|uniref:Phosphoribosyltransferase n=1 Tax=Paenibacillus farraposensis TaxID=2807095 RepID=A0ABW4D8H7_9BACL|nr:phosphoribosyltransferase [Paenibacillus farraposensis]MCC3381779.1 phosphoribosyltransferase [Paenibacillus farraposensis]